MKNLISYSKYALSTLLVIFAFLTVAEAQNLTDFSQVRRQDGLIMQRKGPDNVGKINYIYNDIHDQAFMYMRATKDDLDNNCLLTREGTFMVYTGDPCRDDVDLPPLAADIKLYVNGGARIEGNLFVNGEVIQPGNALWTVVSDKRLKKNISPLKHSLDILKEVEFVEFQYNGLAKTPTEEKYYGVIAQQVGEVLPNTVKTFSERLHPSHKNSTELLMFNPSDLMYTGLNAIKELATVTEDQHEELVKNLEKEKRKNRALENRVTELESKLEQLINSLAQNHSQETLYSNSVLLSAQISDKLHPNIPNPLNHSTLIKYELSRASDKASILIQDTHGSVLQEIMLPNHLKNGTVEFNATNAGLSPGTYIYSLVVNGEVVDSKKMIFVE